MITFFKDSLREKSKKELKKRIPDIWKEIDKPNYRCKTILSKNNAWIYTLTFLTLTFLISILISKINLDWLKFLSFETTQIAQTTLENRISNVATIIGVTLTVSTIMISNIAEKKKENYEAIFQETFIYPIVYYALGLLAFMIVISVFRSVFMEIDAFNNLVILVHYLMVILIVLIGFLFYNIIKFFNTETIKKIHSSNYLNSFKILLREDLIITQNLLNLNRSLVKYNIQKGTKYFFDNNTVTISPFIDSEEYIYDIKINKLMSTVRRIEKQFPDKIFFSDSIWFNRNIEILIYSSIYSDINTKKIQSFYMINSIEKTFKNEYFIFFKIHLQNFKELQETDNIETVNQVFKPFDKAFGFIIKAQKDQNVKFLKNSYTENLVFEFYNFFFYKFKEDIQAKEEEQKRIKWIGDTKLSIKFHQFVFEQLDGSMSNNSPIVFNETVKVLYKLYTYSSDKKNIFIKILSFVKPFKLPYLANDNDVNEIQPIVDFHYELYSQLSIIFSSIFSIVFVFGKLSEEETIMLRKYNEIGKLWDVEYYSYLKLNTDDAFTAQSYIIQSLQRQSFNFFRDLLFAYKSWVYWGYHKERISLDCTSNIVGNLNAQIFSGTESLINNYGRLVKKIYAKNDYLFLERNQFNLFEQQKPTDWLYFGFIIEGLSKLWDSSFNTEKIEDIKIIGGLSEQLLAQMERIKDNSHKWEQLLNCDNKMFNSRYKNFKDILLQLKYVAEIKHNENLSNTPISGDILKSFTENTLNKWKQGFTLLPVFQYFSNIQKMIYTGQKSDFFGINRFVLKETFTENNQYNVSNITDFGLWTGEEGDNLFLEQIAKNSEVKSYNQLQLAISESTQSLKRDGYNVTIIFISFDLISNFYNDEINGFENIYEVTSLKKVSTREIGLLGDIHIIPIRHDQFNKSIIVADFAKAFEMEMIESPDWVDGKLFIDVSELDDEMINDELANHIQEYLSDEISLTEEQIVAKIKTNVSLRILFKVDYKVLNQQAFQFITIEEDN